jgi:hypothetical protein
MTKFKLLLLSFGLPLAMFVLSPLPAYAQDCGSDTKSALQCGASSAAGNNANGASAENDLQDTIINAINIASVIIAVVAVIMIIVGGAKMITSGGNPESVKSARSTVLYAIIGLVIIMLAQLIARFVINIFSDSNTGGG